HRVVVSLYASGLGAYPNGGPSVCPHPARRTDAAPRACGSVGGAARAELHDLPPAAIAGLAPQEAAPTHDPAHAPENGGQTGSSGPSPGAFAAYHGPGTAARAVCVWQHDVGLDDAVPHASGA